ncbi:MAG: flagellar hook-length control protein FliK [Alphaproteobacteria bacterium]|nr:flagellar hook-length control protein FliK [Alphaproteobacteria bacterium]MCB9974103.1 flagellar hook-length control protein FliK [Rhodospirillales bacterium]
MNSDALFTFSAIQKDLQLPANDTAIKSKALTRRAHENASTRNTPHTTQSKGQNDSANSKSFDDYISEASREKDARSEPNAVQEKVLSGKGAETDDLRSLLGDLLAGLRNDKGGADEETSSEEAGDSDPAGLLLSFLADGRRNSKLAGDVADTDGSDRDGFLTQTALQLQKAEGEHDRIPQSLLALLNSAGGQDGLKALSDFLNQEDLSAIDGLAPEILAQLRTEVEAAIEENRDFDSFAALNEIITRIVELTKPEAQSSESVRQSVQASEAGAPDIGHKKDARFESRYDLDRFAQTLAMDTQGGEDAFRSALRTAQALHRPSDGHLESSLKTGTSLPALLFSPGAESGIFSGFAEQGGLFSSLAGSGAVSSNAPTLSGPSLINPALHAPSAAQPHPAVQTVAATLQKFGGEKQDTRITLQLDPPELGRVEVKMSLNKDNAAKVVLTIEKPETFVMLQRDAHVLERALADAGLSADGSGLEFTLADEGYSFGRGGENGSGGRGFAQGGGDKEETVLIASSMGWSVDPVTGRMQYDTLV